MLLAVPVAAADWALQRWTIEDGLPDNHVSEIRQMEDGALLIATYAGMVRFDGLKMSQDGSGPGPARDAIVRAMLPCRDGSRWFATGQSRLIHVSQAGSSVYTPPHDPNAFPLHLAEDAAGALWVTYSEGAVVKIHQGGMEAIGSAHGLPPGGSVRFVLDLNGKFWAVAGGRLYAQQGEVFAPEAALPAPRNWRMSGAVFPASDGGLWLAAGLTLFYRTPDGIRLERIGEVPEDGTHTAIAFLHEDRAGAVWICLHDGNVYRRWEGKLERVGSVLHEITAVTSDREGNIWLGASEGGLWRIRPRVLAPLSEAGPLVEEAMCTVTQDTRGDMWLTGTNGHLLKRENGVWRRVGPESGWQAGIARVAVAGPDGRVWVGTKDEGVFEHQPGAGFALRPFPSPPPWGNIRAMLATPTGGLWVAVNAELWHLHQNQWNLHSSNLPDAYIQTLVQSPSGAVWAGTNEGHLLTLDVEGRLVDRASRELGGEAVRTLLFTPDDTLWLGCSGEGLARYKNGHFSRLGAREGLSFTGISHLLVDDGGLLWAGSAQGIFHVALESLNDLAEGRLEKVHVTRMGRDEGLRNAQSGRGYWPNCLRDRDGHLWFNLRTGTALADPRQAVHNPVPPPVTIERVKVDGTDSPFTPTRPLVLVPGHHGLELSLAAMSFRSPVNVKVVYRMNGWDEAWITAGDDRKALYSRLPHGRYLFEAAAANESGIWSEAVASLAVVVRPFFWQTWWFRAGGVTLLLLAAGGGLRAAINRRWRAQMALVERRAALDRERTRIARDMHDELGASLTQIAIASQLAQLDPPEASPGHIAEVAAIARRAVTSLDEIVWAVNPRNDTLGSLVDYLGQYAVDFLSPAGVACEVEIPENIPDRPVPAEARHHLFLAVKEALTNLVRHAGASRAVVRFRLSPTHLEVVVADNGRGFESGAEAAPGSDGVRHLRERLGEAGGECLISSQPGDGTEVTFRLPWPGAPL